MYIFKSSSSSSITSWRIPASSGLALLNSDYDHQHLKVRADLSLHEDKTKNLIPSSKLKFPATFTLPY